MQETRYPGNCLCRILSLTAATRHYLLPGQDSNYTKDRRLNMAVIIGDKAVFDSLHAKDPNPTAI